LGQKRADIALAFPSPIPCAESALGNISRREPSDGFAAAGSQLMLAGSARCASMGALAILIDRRNKNIQAL
jgi:hypothetical protein